MDWKHHMPAIESMDLEVVSTPSKRDTSPTPGSPSVLHKEKKTKLREDDATGVVSNDALIPATSGADGNEVVIIAISQSTEAADAEVDEAKAVETQIRTEDERAASRKTEKRWSQANWLYGMKPMTVNGRKYLLGTKSTAPSLLDMDLRPIAEPPLFDFEWMFEEKGWFESIEKGHDRTWGTEPGFKTARTDLIIEARLLLEYNQWKSETNHAFKWWTASLSISGSEAESRRRFLKGLGENLWLDMAEVELELHDLECSKQRIRHDWQMDYEEKQREIHGELYLTPAEKREELAEEVDRSKLEISKSERQRVPSGS